MSDGAPPPSGSPGSDPADQVPPPVPPDAPSPYPPPGSTPPPATPAPGAPPPYGHPYGQPQPYGQGPYGQQPTVAPQPPPVYGGYPPPTYAGYGPAADPDRRPGTVLAGSLVAIVSSGITALICGLGIVGMLAARDDFLREVRRQSEFQDLGMNADDLFTGTMVLLVFIVVWSLVGCLLGALALRRSRVARVLLVISAGVVVLLSLVTIASLFSALWLLAGGATIVLMFVGGANDWYARRGSPSYPPPYPY